MKRIGTIACLAALIVTIAASVCFGAQSLKVVDNYPEDGQKNTTKDNMCVKLTFNNEMGNEETAKANEDCFQIVSEKGKKVPVRAFYNPENPTEVMVLADNSKETNPAKLNIEDDTKYTLTVSKDLIDNDGNTLGEDFTVSFTTINQGRSTSIYMVMMVIMFGAIFFFSSRQMKKQRAKENGTSAKKEEVFNPYKEAKRTGKPVEEIIAAHEKEMARKAAREARKAAREKQEAYEEEEYNDNYKVKTPRTVASAGSSYVTGRKAIAEAKKAEEARLAKKRAANNKKKKK